MWIDRGRAPRTIDAYARGLAEYLLVCKRGGIDPVAANRSHVAAFVKELARRPSHRGSNVVRLDSGVGLSNATLQQRLVSVRLFYDYLIEEGLRETNPVGRGRYTPGRSFGSYQRSLVLRVAKLPWFPSEQQWLELLAVVREEPIRNCVMLALAYDAALRREELRSLRTGDLDPAHRRLRIRAETTKTRRDRVVPYSAATGGLMSDDLKHRATISKARGPRFLSESRRNCGQPVDVATRSICAALLRPGGTKAVDAALLLARMLVPEPMRPGWAQSLAMSHSPLPHGRLLAVDERLAAAAAKPVIVPSVIGVNHGKMLVSETFTAACRLLGISVQPARPATPTDKGIAERTFSSINSLFCQHVAGYTGSDVTRRGTDAARDAVWTFGQLQDLLDEWIIAGWQNRPHDALRNPYMPGRALTPNESYAIAVVRAGYLPLPLAGKDYLELLPVEWRVSNDYRITIDYRTYDSPDLNPHRRRDSGLPGKRGLWEVHYVL